MAGDLGLVDVVGDLCAKGCITADDVLTLRRTVYADGVCSEAEAESVFRLNDACPDRDPDWHTFYVEVLTDYFVRQSTPKGYVSEAQADRLIDRVTGDGRVDRLSELELLVNILRRATACPERLVLFVLDAVRDSILTPDAALYGADRQPGTITSGDVAILREAVHGPAGEGSITVTRREAELLFELNDATRGQPSAPEWQDFFVRAVANHLMFPRPAPQIVDAGEAMRREAWLEERRGAGGLLWGIARALGRRDVPFEAAWRDADVLRRNRARELAEAEARRTSEAMAREAVDAGECAWLAGRIGRDGVLDDNERALLAFIRANSPHIDPSLNDAMARAGV